jgi:hypothetical protein
MSTDSNAIHPRHIVYQQPGTILDMQRYDRNDPDPAVRLRIRVARTIVRFALRSLVAAGYSVAVRSDLGFVSPTRDPELAMEDIMQEEHDVVLVYPADAAGTDSPVQAIGQMHFSYGDEGWDVIRECSPNLTEVLNRVKAYANAMRSWC